MPASLRTNLAEIARELRPKVSAAVKDGAQDVAKTAAALVPVDEGDLKKAIHVERRGMAEYAVVAGNRDVFYGHLIEHGSSVGGRGRPPQPPHPFLVPALEMHRRDITARVEDALEDARDARG